MEENNASVFNDGKHSVLYRMIKNLQNIKLEKNTLKEIKNTNLSFDYLTLNKRVEFERVSTEKFENWLSIIWENIQSLTFNKNTIFAINNLILVTDCSVIGVTARNSDI